jgi:hypothetical protein
MQDEVRSILMVEDINRGETVEEITVETPAADADMGHGTRNPDTVDAMGPYGEGIPFDPHYEGDPITFGAEIEPTDEHDNYKFRWDADGDGNFDGPGDASTDYFGEDGESEYTMTFYDDYQGVALVEAWDGSWTWITEDGIVLGEEDDNAYWSISGNYFTWGWQFEVTADIEVDELGFYENGYGDPGTYLAVRIYDDVPKVIAEVTYPTMPGGGNWGWETLSTPVDLYTGTTYCMAAYTYNYWGYMCALTDVPSESPDGIVQIGSPGYAAGNNYPNPGTLGGGIPMVDFHYEHTYAYPNVLSDCADVLVWNRDPSVFSPTVTPTTTLEGEETSQFSAQMMDIGIMDEWWYQWEWGDGDYSDWYPIPTWKGGIDVFWLHAYTGQIDAIMEEFKAELGPHVKYQEAYDCGQAGSYNAPPLEKLLEFDVVIIGSNYIPAAAVSDVVADYCELGGGVVELVAMMHPTFGIGGAWRNEYSVFPQSSTLATGSSLTIYDDTHPIIDGQAGVVTSYGCSLCIGLTSLQPGATLLADYDTGWKAAAYRDEDNVHAGSGRVAGLNIFPQAGYVSGDAHKAIANAAFWASQGEPAVKLSLPLTLPPISHIYKDDHPVTTTPSDQVQPRVRVKDDDHCNDRILGTPVILDENFDSGWGPYGDNPPAGWTIESYASKAWDYNDWHRYYFSGLGMYTARVYYTPDEDQDEELISPEIDVSGSSTVNFAWDQYYYNYYGTGQADVDYRLDGGSWVNIESWTTSTYYTYPDEDITTGGASTLELRFHFTDWTADYKYWCVGDVEVTDGKTVLFEEDWDGSWGIYGDNPPAGWTIIDNGVASSSWGTNDWHMYYFYGSYPGGTDTNAARVYYYPYGPNDDWLITPVLDLTIGGLSAARLSFDTYFYWYYYYSECNVMYSLDGGAWQMLDQYTGTTSGLQEHTLDFAIGHTLQIAFHRYGTNQYNYFYWFVDNFLFEAIPELKHVYGMSDWVDAPLVTVANVAPSIIVPDAIPKTVTENTPITFEGIELFDPAMYEETEQMFWRLDMDDETGPGPWNFVGKVLPDQYEEFEQNPATWPWSPWERYAGTPPYFEAVHAGAAHDKMYGLEIDQGGYMWYYREDLSLGGNPGDKLNFWLNVPGYGPSMTQSGRAYMGFGADSVGAYEFIIAPNTNQIMIYDDYPYGSFSELASTPYTFTYDGWYRCETEFHSLTEVTVRLFADDGVTLLAELTHNHPSGYNLPGGLSFRAFDYGLTPRHFYIDSYNAGDLQIDKWIPTFESDWKDNGIYYPDVQTIDDDMWWDFSTGDPVFVGPNMDPDNPGADPEDWIAHNYIPVEVLNTDPVVSPIRAYAPVDLSLRMSGTKTHEATMTLYENGMEIGYTEVTRVPGAPNIGVISNVELEMTKDYEYEVEIVVDPKGGGGSNPTWIFDMVFPSGKFKEFKFTFNDEHGWTQTISNGELKKALLGHDIIFEAAARDIGSDDLAFVWVWGDQTPLGVHLYANVDQMTTVEGTSDEAQVLFDQLPNRDAWFDKPANTKRTPNGRPIYAMDSISHVFDDSKGYYYYVALIVMDDDVDDDYPSTQLHTGPGCDMAYVELNFV